MYVGQLGRPAVHWGEPRASPAQCCVAWPDRSPLGHVYLAYPMPQGGTDIIIFILLIIFMFGSTVYEGTTHALALGGNHRRLASVNNIHLASTTPFSCKGTCLGLAAAAGCGHCCCSWYSHTASDQCLVAWTALAV